ncbi:acyl-CoA-binding domain-containing protein 6 isoform X2 [Equus przewalskii]|uniref:Acyl-CoA-binding domain-containing protein 6 n=1 Tax=Equus przewalskii TaxID=9798 RepID=A0ABM4M572_EQUPR
MFRVRGARSVKEAGLWFPLWGELSLLVITDSSRAFNYCCGEYLMELLLEAWKALGDSSPSQAMQEYIAAVKKLDPGWNPQSPEKKGKAANTGFGGPVVSSLYHEEIIREEDKNIFDYCRENNIDHITKVIKSKNVDVNMKDEEGRALLHWACDRGHKELVTVLLQYRADINCQDNEGQTALHYAAACEFLDIVELLLQSGADPTLRDQDGCLPEEVTGCKAVSLVLQQHTTGKA